MFDDLVTTNENIAPIVKATTGLITPLISGVDAEFTGLLEAGTLQVDTIFTGATVLATTKVEAPEVCATTKVVTVKINAPVDQSSQEQEMLTGHVDLNGPKITVGGGTFIVDDVSQQQPSTAYTTSKIHHSWDDTKEDGLIIAPTYSQTQHTSDDGKRSQQILQNPFETTRQYAIQESPEIQIVNFISGSGTAIEELPTYL